MNFVFGAIKAKRVPKSKSGEFFVESPNFFFYKNSIFFKN